MRHPGNKVAVVLGSGLTQLKNNYACVTFDPVDATAGAKISTLHIPNERPLSLLTSKVKFQLVFGYETVEFRRYVLALLLVVLLEKLKLICSTKSYLR